MSRMRWHRYHQPRRSVSSRCGNPLSGLQGGKICQARRQRKIYQQKRGGIFSAGTHGNGYKLGFESLQRLKIVSQRLKVLQNLGLGYLTLGEETPGLSGGEAQRLKLASEMGKGQADSVFVFDEPTIGLHPLDVQTLLDVFQTLVNNGATVIIIEHDLDVIRNADYIIDMGPGGGTDGGCIVATGTPEQIAAAPASITGKFI